MPGGRPTIFKEEYCEQIIKYFDIEPYEIKKIEKTNRDGTKEEKFIELVSDLPLFSKFAVKIGVHRETLLNWCKKYPEFLDAYKKAKELQRNILITNGLRGNYQTAFAIFTAKNVTDLRDKQEIEHSGGMSLTLEDTKKIAENILSNS
jgi:hypothetical protein